jgi:hypothetical protein
LCGFANNEALPRWYPVVGAASPAHVLTPPRCMALMQQMVAQQPSQSESRRHTCIKGRTNSQGSSRRSHNNRFRRGCASVCMCVQVCASVAILQTHWTQRRPTTLHTQNTQNTLLDFLCVGLTMVLALLQRQRMRGLELVLAVLLLLLQASSCTAQEPSVVGELSMCPTETRLYSSDVHLGEPQSSTETCPALWREGAAGATLPPGAAKPAGIGGSCPPPPLLPLLLRVCRNTAGRVAERDGCLQQDQLHLGFSEPHAVQHRQGQQQHSQQCDQPASAAGLLLCALCGGRRTGGFFTSCK